MNIDCVFCDHCPFVETQKELHYEIHITVNWNDDFEEHCRSIGVKPVVIDMGDGIPSHTMTSSTLVNSNDQEAFIKANSIAEFFKDSGYTVRRVKIETVPWHPNAIENKNNKYFETHFAVKYPFDEDLLKSKAKDHNLHYSRNSLKKGDKKVQMLTYRRYGVISETYLKEVELIKNSLGSDFIIDKVINEYAIYDSNIDLDNQWLGTDR